MRTSHILLLCILGAALFSSVICDIGIGPDECCFTYVPRRIKKEFIRTYYWTDSQCRKPGVILVTQKSLHICADPSLPWVERVMEFVDQCSY